MRRAWNRKRGSPTEAVNFRCPKELVDFAQAHGRSLSEGMVRLLDIGRDAMTEIGDLWPELEVYAVREGITESEAVGKLARAILAQRSKK